MENQENDLKLELNISRIKRTVFSKEFWGASGFLLGNLTGFTVGMLMANTEDDEDATTDSDYEAV